MGSNAIFKEDCSAAYIKTSSDLYSEKYVTHRNMPHRLEGVTKTEEIAHVGFDLKINISLSGRGLLIFILDGGAVMGQKLFSALSYLHF